MKRRDADETPPVTPWTRPDLRPLSPDDPAVVALTSPARAPDALPPSPWDDSGPMPLVDPARDIDEANRQLAAAAPRTDRSRLADLEAAVRQLRHDVDNITAWLRLEYGRG